MKGLLLYPILVNRSIIMRTHIFYFIPVQFLDNKDGHTWREGEWIAHQVWCQKTEQCQRHFLNILRQVADKKPKRNGAMVKVKSSQVRRMADGSFQKV